MQRVFLVVYIFCFIILSVKVILIQNQIDILNEYMMSSLEAVPVEMYRYNGDE